TEEIAGEGLRDEILYAAERSFRIDKSRDRSTVRLAQGDIAGDEPEEDPPSAMWETKNRPRRGGSTRLR
ncbi:MAG: hypothetical protein MUP70_15155, partial [Candidatus Aminicenantes bacterium]|nr:hypothetical protein [Candidatus Aminicenantes bacterium]